MKFDLNNWNLISVQNFTPSVSASFASLRQNSKIQNSRVTVPCVIRINLFIVINNCTLKKGISFVIFLRVYIVTMFECGLMLTTVFQNLRSWPGRVRKLCCVVTLNRVTCTAQIPLLRGLQHFALLTVSCYKMWYMMHFHCPRFCSKHTFSDLVF